MPAPIPYSKSQINKAGRTLRRAMRGELVAAEVSEQALRILEGFRAAHQVSLTTAGMGLRSMVNSEGCRLQVSQRLKRRETILDKLLREPTMQLANMQDIAGCRAVLASIDEVRRVQRRVQKRRPEFVLYDYISDPRESGYRGVHLVVDYHGRKIEIQLRTPAMHEWAIAVERFGGRIHADLKSGQGPEEVLDFLAAVSRAIAIEEVGGMVDAQLESEIGRLRLRALPRLEGKG